MISTPSNHIAGDHSPTPDAPERRDAEVLVIGGGISGIGAAIGLRRAGVDDVLILERADELGGTWRDNTYPGCACDIPSHLYSYSFAPNPEWTRVFAERDEIQRYVLGVADRYSIRRLARLETEVLDASWDDERQRWVLHTTTGRYTARALVIAAGPLHEPVVPDFPGAGRFKGTAFHSSHWPQDHDFADERVAVIGTGASAGQFVPRIQSDVASLTILQRTPPWVMPKPDWPTTRLERRVLRRWPGLIKIARMVQWAPLDALIVLNFHPRLARASHVVGKLHMRRAIKDKALRRVLTPDYVMGCKRVLLTNEYYPALAKPNVEVLPQALAEIREHSIVTADGIEREVDTLIFGTGFHVTDLPISERVRGRDGRTLAEVWQGSPTAYLGTSISGFPNAFMLFGPNVGTASAFVMLDAQVRYLTQAVTALNRQGLGSIDVLPEVQQEFKAEADRRLAGSTFNAGGCTSYYIDANGRNASAWPGTMLSLTRRLRRFTLADYRCDRVRESADPALPIPTEALR